MNSVLIVDDHPVARLAVRMLLEKDGMTVIGETDDGLKALQQARQLLPDLVIVDIDIPTINGINVVQRLRANDFKGGILVLTGKDDDHYIKRCAGAGADGFISKRNNLTELHDAIHAIKSGYGFSRLTAPARLPQRIFHWMTKGILPVCRIRNCRFCIFWQKEAGLSISPGK